MAQKRGRSRQQEEAISRFWKDLPIIEAPVSLRVFVNNDDIVSARPKDPKNCVYANACKRLYGASAILFFRTVAYVDLPDMDGVRSVNRFQLGRTVRQRIAEFDSTRKAHPGGFLLSAGSKSTSLEARRRATTEHVKRTRGEAPPIHKKQRDAALKGVATRRRNKHAVMMAGMATDVRDGTGMVHFIQRSRKKRKG